MNVLLTSAGRRSYLVKYFKEALQDTGNVYTVNSTNEATSMYVSDGAFKAPEIYNPEYIPFLKKICRKCNIDLLLSLFDLDLSILSMHKKEFENIGVCFAVSNENVIEICNDKIKTVNYLNKLGLKTLWTSDSLRDTIQAIKSSVIYFPLFIKPRWGTGSIGIQMVENENELHVLYDKVKKDINRSYLRYFETSNSDRLAIIQEKATGHEYGLDIVNDLDGNFITTFVKKKLAMRSGETDGAVTVVNTVLSSLGEKIGKSLKHVGNLDVDVFWDGEEPVVLEMNARFGGGYPFSHLAGANIPKAYIQWSQNRSASDDCFSIKQGVKGFKKLDILDCSREIVTPSCFDDFDKKGY